MKNLFVGITFLLLLSFAVVDDPLKGTGIWYFGSVPDKDVSDLSLGTEIAYNYNARSLWVWNRSTSTWEFLNKIQYKAGVPSAAPSYGNIGYYDTDTGILYRYRGIILGWQEVGGVSISQNSSPILTELDGVLSLDFSNLVGSDANNIATSIASSTTAIEALEEKVNPIDSLSTFSFSDSQIDSLVQRIIATQIAVTQLNSVIGDKVKNTLVDNSSGADVFVKHTGKEPTFTGNTGVFTLTFNIDSTDVKGFNFGGGTNDNVWNGSGDLQLNVTLENVSPSTADINGIFADLQLINAGNSEVLSDPKGQLGVSIFQERISIETVQIRASNLSGFGTDGFKLIAKY